jgi:hypothetical protein
MDSDPTQPEETQTQEPAEAAAQEAEQEQPAPEEGPADVEAKDEAAEEPAESEEEKPAEPEAKPAEAKHKRKGGFERKIEKYERQIEDLTRLLIQNGQAPKPAAEPAKALTPEQQAREHLDRLLDERLEARERAKREADAKVEFARTVSEHERRMEAYAETKPDFYEALESVRHISVPPHMTEALLTSEHGPAIMDTLARDPAALARICALPPLVAAREIGRLEAKAASGSAPPPTPKPAARPPAPPTSVTGTKSGTRSLDDAPISEYKRLYRSGRR